MGTRTTTLLLLACTLAAATAGAQPPWAGGPGRRGGEPSMQEDRQLFHELLTHREAIRRSVREIPGGVETLTESQDPAVAAIIRRHAHAMHARLREGRPIHRRDPLFAALFAHAGAIEMQVEDTPQGVRVRETSEDRCAQRLVREHASVVSRFLAYGWAEVQRDHPVPPC